MLGDCGPSRQPASELSLAILLQRAWACAVAAICAAVFAPLAALAAEDSAAETAYRAKPDAAVAEQIVRRALEHNQTVKAINWAERMVRSPGATADQQALAAKLRGQLRWKLGDLGYAEVKITVRPPTALVLFDGKELLPRTGVHVLWATEGNHEVSAEAPEFTTSLQHISAVRNEKAAVELMLASTKAPILRVFAKPACDVWIDGVLAGPSRKVKFALAPGPHRVELRAAGFASQQREFEVNNGDELEWDAQLVAGAGEKGGPGGVHRASDVNREVTERELNETGETGPNIAHAPEVDSPLDGKRDSRVSVSRPTGKSGALPSERKVGPDISGKAPADGGEAPAVFADPGGTASAPWSGRTKGWLLAAPGLAALAGGAAWAMLGAREAEKVNQSLAYGDPGYDAAYDAAAKKATLGYAAAGAGALLTAGGAYYLFGRDGLGRSGKGRLLAGAGALALGAAAYTWLGARAVLASAGGFTAAHPEYQRRVDLGHRDSNLAYGIGGAGLIAAGIGSWLWLGGPSRSADSDLGAPSRWALVPVSGNGQTGALLSWTF